MTVPARLRRLLGLLLAVLLVGTVIGAWVRALRPGDRLDDQSGFVERVDWVATLAPDGTLAVRDRIALRPGAAAALPEAGLVVALPPAATRVRVDGEPVAVPAPGRVDVAVPGESVTIEYEVPGAARRTSGGALLATQVAPSFGQFTADYGYAEVRATLVLPQGAAATEADWRLPGAKVVRGDSRGRVLAVAGAASTYDSVALVADLPRAAAPDAPEPDPVAGGSGAAAGGAPGAGGVPSGAGSPAVQRRLAEALAAGDMDGAADALAGGRVPSGEPVPQGPVATVVAVLVTVELVGLALYVGWRYRRARRRAAAYAAEGFGAALDDDTSPPARTRRHSRRSATDPSTRSPEAGAMPPDDVAPDVVAMLVAGDGATVATREAVAADLLRLVDRGQVTLESLDSRRFVLRVPPGTVGETAAERAIVGALRPQAQSAMASQLMGPPLWATGPHAFLATVEADVRRRARQAGYLARALRLGVFVPLVALVPLTALLGSGNDDRVGVVAGLALLAALALSAVVSATSPLSLTPAGEQVRRRARAFARTAAETDAVDDLGAPAVLVRGSYLVYAVATGVAPTAARDVGTGRTLVALPAVTGPAR